MENKYRGPFGLQIISEIKKSEARQLIKLFVAFWPILIKMSLKSAYEVLAKNKKNDNQKQIS